jgi:creatinine amidohydrolase
MSENIVFAEMTWTEIEEAMKDRPVALVPVGATLAHGPHLPVTADAIVATEMARRGAAKLKEHGVSSLVLPPVLFSVADMGGDFPGSLSAPKETATALLRDTCIVAARKFRAVGLINVHLEPAHVEVLKKAVEEAKKGGASVCHVDVLKKRWAEMIGAFDPTEHAGASETSLVMAAAPQVVRDSARRNLAPVENYKDAFKKGAKTYAEAGGEDAYFGDPTAASAEDGDALYEILAEIVSLSVMEHLGSKA